MMAVPMWLCYETMEYRGYSLLRLRSLFLTFLLGVLYQRCYWNSRLHKLKVEGVNKYLAEQTNESFPSLQHYFLLGCTANTRTHTCLRAINSSPRGEQKVKQKDSREQKRSKKIRENKKEAKRFGLEQYCTVHKFIEEFQNSAERHKYSMNNDA